MKTYDLVINGDAKEKIVCLTFFDEFEDSNDALEIRVPITLESAKMLKENLDIVIEALTCLNM